MWFGNHVNGTMYNGSVIPEHVKDPRTPVDKSRVLIPGVTGQDTIYTKNSCILFIYCHLYSALSIVQCSNALCRL